MKSNTDIRKALVSSCRRVVIKAGTRLLTDRTALSRLVGEIRLIREKGIQVLLVSSGAVGTGMKSLGLTARPKRLSEVQALAAIGQIHLMSVYDEECRKLGFQAAQLLLTADDLRVRERHLNTLNCVEALLEKNILPIVNENDPVSAADMKFGDNDILAALLASMMRADLAVILTSVDGLLRPNPDGTLGERISVVNGLDEEIRGMARGTDDSAMSIGGMASKLKCADILNASGDALWIADGRDASVLRHIFAGEDVGTVFLPHRTARLDARKRWLRSFARSAGKIFVDAGAVRALEHSGRSLLPSGVTGTEGKFSRGSVVEILAPDGRVIARGLTNYSASFCQRLQGHQTGEIHDILRCAADAEIVHRNNMVLLRQE